MENLVNFFMKLKKLDLLKIQDIKISSLTKLDTKIKKYSDKIEINIRILNQQKFYKYKYIFTYTFWTTSC